MWCVFDFVTYEAIYGIEIESLCARDDRSSFIKPFPCI